VPRVGDRSVAAPDGADSVDPPEFANPGLGCERGVPEVVARPEGWGEGREGVFVRGCG